MAISEAQLAAVGVRVPDILIPTPGADWKRWAVVACDQYSSEKEYWERVDADVGAVPSTLRLVYPECYLEEKDGERRIAAIQESMNAYLAKGVFRPPVHGFVLVERATPTESKPRLGLMIAVDLETYVYGKGSSSLIRPTEGTIVERLPPRMRIRRGASLELPHIMLLIDDPQRTVIEPLYAARAGLEKLYDFDLMEGSGRVAGWRIWEEPLLSRVANALGKLADRRAFREKYGKDDALLFAVGDGNHSLATAKGIWEEVKAAGADDPAIMEHPARWALVELVNIYDEGLPFHPIHRVLMNADAEAFIRDLSVREGWRFEAMDRDKAIAMTDERVGEHRFAVFSKTASGLLRVAKPEASLAAGTIQEFLDPWLKDHPKVAIDYIHGTESTVALGTKKDHVGIYLPPIDKAGFFGTVIREGAMPRKTFSMGEAPEKRFYVEARKIVR